LVTPILRKSLQTFESFLEAKDLRKFSIWFTHDMIIGSVATYFGLLKNREISYASFINFELYRRQNESLYLKINFND